MGAVRPPRLRIHAASMFLAVASPAAAFEDRVEQLFRPLQGEHIAISPDGRRVAYTTFLERRLGLTILDLERGSARRTIAVDTDPEGKHGDDPGPTRVRFLRWASADRLVLAPEEQLLPAPPAGPGPLFDGPFVRAPIVVLDADGQRQGVLVDARTFVETAAESRGAPADFLKPATQARGAGDGPVRMKMPRLDILGFYPREKEQLIVQTRGGYGPPAQYLVDVRTGAVTEFGGDWPAPPAPPQVYDWFRLKAVGSRLPGPGSAATWQDEDLARVQRTLEAKFPRRRVDVLDWSENRGRIVFRVTGGSDPGRGFVWLRPDDLVVELFRNAPWYVPAKFNETRPFRFSTADGATMGGRITWPRKQTGAAWPLLVVFPGAAGGRPAGAFDPEAQVFADQGFAVLSLDRPAGAGGHGVIEEVHAAIDWLAARHPERALDRSRLAALGHGDGGATAWRALQGRPDWFRCGALLDAPGEIGPAAEARVWRADPGLAAAAPGARAAVYRNLDAFFRQHLVAGIGPAGAKREVE